MRVYRPSNIIIIIIIITTTTTIIIIIVIIILFVYYLTCYKYDLFSANEFQSTISCGETPICYIVAE